MAQALEEVIDPPCRAVVVVERVSGDDQAEDDAGERGVDACLPERQPEEDAADRVHPEVAHAEALGRQQERDRADHPEQPLEPDRFGVEDRDDQDAADIVGDGEREEEDLELHGHARSDQGQHAERKGDVGCDGNAPARDARATSC